MLDRRMYLLDRSSLLDPARDVKASVRVRVSGVWRRCVRRPGSNAMERGTPGSPCVTHPVGDSLEALSHIRKTGSRRVEHSRGVRDSLPVVMRRRKGSRDRTNGSGNLSLERMHDRKRTIDGHVKAIWLVAVGQVKPEFPRVVLSRSENCPSQVFFGLVLPRRRSRNLPYPPRPGRYRPKTYESCASAIPWGRQSAAFRSRWEPGHVPVGFRVRGEATLSLSL
jgi:hypothetical protein